MNCQDISRIVDSGSIRNLSTAEHSAAESHARTCRDCAAIWGVQSRLASVRVPATPPEIAARLRALAVLPIQPARGQSPRRLVLICSVFVLAAAAAVLTFRRADAPVVQPQPSAVAISAMEPVVATDVPMVAAAVVAEAVPAKIVARLPAEPAPLLFPPPSDSGAQLGQLVQPALQKAVERYPELVEGPQIDGTFVVGVALRPDGSVVSSAIRQAPADGIAAASAEINALLPGEGGITGMHNPDSTRLRDGRTLRARVLLSVRSIPDGFDNTKSSSRVLQILGDKYAYLMAPPRNGELNRLEVFLAGDGSILREHTDIVRQGDGGTSLTDNPADVAGFAEGIAKRLGVDVGQIGLVGKALKSQGPMAVPNPAGGLPLSQNTPRLLINYAWVRGAGESAPKLGGGASPSWTNTTAALAFVERYFPDVFTVQDSGSMAAVILSPKGEFIRAGRLPQAPQSIVMQAVRMQLADGKPLNRMQSMKLTNAAGVTAEVYFAWERPETVPTNPTN